MAVSAVFSGICAMGERCLDGSRRKLTAVVVITVQDVTVSLATDLSCAADAVTTLVADGRGVVDGRGVREGVSVGPTTGTGSAAQPDIGLTKSALTHPSTAAPPSFEITRHHFLLADWPVTGRSDPAKTLPMACCWVEGSPRKLSAVCAVTLQAVVVLTSVLAA